MFELPFSSMRVSKIFDYNGEYKWKTVTRENW